MASLLSFLQNYTNSFLPMHMPGGKRSFPSPLPYQWDVTDLEATDDLYHPAGILKELQDRAASLWKADRSFLLVNGSTAGILTAVRATGAGDILAGRNSHKSFFHAAELCGRRTFYVWPERVGDIFGSLSPEQIREGLREHPSVTTVFLTSPTYEGVVSDIASIAEICRKANVTLIVDEAHGAHFGFSPFFPASAVTLGADIVVQSLHKTLPALTQTAVLHCRAPFADAVARELPVFQTSSPSYLLLASADECMRFLETGNPFEPYANRLLHLRESMQGLNVFRLLDGDRFFDYDRGKIVLLTTPPYTGSFCANRIRNHFRVETEMSAPSYFLAMTSVCDTESLCDRFLEAVLRTDEELSAQPQLLEDRADGPAALPVPERVFEPYEARLKKKNICAYYESAGKVSADYVWAYPPGVPMILPGERIPSEFPALAESFRRAGILLRASTPQTGFVSVLE